MVLDLNGNGIPVNGCLTIKDEIFSIDIHRWDEGKYGDFVILIKDKDGKIISRTEVDETGEIT